MTDPNEVTQFDIWLAKMRVKRKHARLKWTIVVSVLSWIIIRVLMPEASWQGITLFTMFCATIFLLSSYAYDD